MQINPGVHTIEGDLFEAIQRAGGMLESNSTFKRVSTSTTHARMLNGCVRSDGRDAHERTKASQQR